MTNTDSGRIDPEAIVTDYFGIACPHCDRQERFDDELTARAWVTGHIQAAHAGELPAFDGGEE